MGHKVKWDRIILLVVFLCIGIFLIFGYPSYSPLPELTATSTAWMLSGIGIDSIADGNHLVVSYLDYDRPFELSPECGGIILFSMFIIGIFLIPGFDIKHKLSALLFVPILFFGNIIRIVLGIVVGYKYSINAAVLFHNSIGQVLMFLVIIVCYVIWLKATRNFPVETEQT